jgi:hypothetical protein
LTTGELGYLQINESLKLTCIRSNALSHKLLAASGKPSGSDGSGVRAVGPILLVWGPLEHGEAGGRLADATIGERLGIGIFGGLLAIGTYGESVGN